MEFHKLLTSRINESLDRAAGLQGSINYASDFTEATCAFRAFSGLLPEIDFPESKLQEIVHDLQRIIDKARSLHLQQFATHIDDIRNELIGERPKRLRNHW